MPTAPNNPPAEHHCSACSAYLDQLREWEDADAAHMLQPLIVDEKGVATHAGTSPPQPTPPACWDAHVDERNDQAAADPYVEVYQPTRLPNGRLVQPGRYQAPVALTHAPRRQPTGERRPAAKNRAQRSHSRTGTSGSRSDPPDDPDPSAKASPGLPSFAEFASWPLHRRYRYMWKAVRDDDRLTVAEREHLLAWALYPQAFTPQAAAA